MTAFHVDIDGRKYEGDYGDVADAIYGCMRKDAIDRREERRGIESRMSPAGRQAIHELRRRQGPLQVMVGAEEVRGRKVTKKVHKV